MKRPLILVLLVLGALCTACGPHFDEESANHFTELKTFHLGFIDRFIGTAGKTYDEATVRSGCDEGTVAFGNAKAYLDSKRDKKAMKALVTLRNQFDKDCRFLQNMEKLYSPSYAAGHKAALSANYDHAIAAEYKDVKELD
jgi:hypothetical protein